MANMIQSGRDFAGDVQEEMRKVTWPDWPQLKNSTFVIIVFVSIIAAIIFVMDIGVRSGLNVLRSLVGG